MHPSREPHSAKSQFPYQWEYSNRYKFQTIPRFFACQANGMVVVGYFLHSLEMITTKVINMYSESQVRARGYWFPNVCSFVNRISFQFKKFGKSCLIPIWPKEIIMAFHLWAALPQNILIGCASWQQLLSSVHGSNCAIKWLLKKATCNLKRGEAASNLWKIRDEISWEVRLVGTRLIFKSNLPEQIDSKK